MLVTHKRIVILALATVMLVLLSSPRRLEADDPGLAPLQELLASEIEAYPGRVAIAVTDLQTGESISLNGDRWQYAGCTINAFTLWTVGLVYQDTGRLPPYIHLYNVATVSWAPANTALVFWLGDGDVYRGLERINQALQEYDFGVFYDHPPGYDGYSLGNRENYITAKQMNRFWTGLHNRQMIGPEAAAWAFDLFKLVGPKYNTIIPARLPSRARVFHKVGFFYYVSGVSAQNDSGLVVYDDGEKAFAYAITFLSEPLTISEYFWENEAFGAKLSRMVFDNFYERY